MKLSRASHFKIPKQKNKAGKKRVKHYLNSIDKDYGVPPTCEQFVCMAKLFSQVRAGQFD